MRTLQDIRRELHEIDRQILNLAARRTQIAAEASPIKQRLGLEVFDARQHDLKRKYFASEARELGLDPAIAEGLFALLTIEALCAQGCAKEQDGQARDNR